MVDSSQMTWIFKSKPGVYIIENNKIWSICYFGDSMLDVWETRLSAVILSLYLSFILVITWEGDSHLNLEDLEN